MACTTILVGKKASYDGSTLIARNDDSPSGIFTAKKMVVIRENKLPRTYVSKISHVKIDLPEYSYRTIITPNVEKDEGVWAASGINRFNVAMSATETITSNPLVLGADPLVTYDKKLSRAGGIGEEDLVYIILPYIKSAKEGVLRLGSLLEKYGTYESNGIAFSDKNDIWYLETIGGHHWIAKRVKDDHYVVMPNQFGIDNFDFEDAFTKQEENLCSKDLKDFIINNHLDLNLDNNFNPRLAFGSHSDSDHTYNTPRAWYITKYLNPTKYDFEKELTPESDNIPWSNIPERKITIEDIKYLLSSHYQGTIYDPYSKLNGKDFKPIYRPIGISRTSFVHISQIRPYVDEKIAAIQWLGFGSNVFNTLVPIYANVDKIPNYLSNTTMKVSTNNFYWASRLIGALVDSHYQTTIVYIERYQNKTMAKNHELIIKYDNEYLKTKNINCLNKANDEITENIQKETDKTLDNVLYQASNLMKNSFSRSDN